MRAVVYLERIQKLDELIDAKILEYEDLLERATSMAPNMDGMPHAPGVSDKVGNGATRLAAKMEEIDLVTDTLIDYRDEALALLEQLPPLEYRVLHRFYVMYWTMDTIAQKMGKSERQCHRIKGNGLRRLQAMLDAREAAFKPTYLMQPLDPEQGKTTN